MNPWAQGNDTLLGINLGDPQSGLVHANRHNLQSRDGTAESIAGRPSIKLIKLLQEIEDTKSELDRVELELLRRTMDSEVADLIHVDILDGRLQKINKLLGHFTTVTTSKGEILSILQSTSAQNSLKMEAASHRAAFELVHSMGKLITSLPNDCERLEWAKRLDLSKTSLQEKAMANAEAISQCRTTYTKALHLLELQKEQ